MHTITGHIQSRTSLEPKIGGLVTKIVSKINIYSKPKVTFEEAKKDNSMQI